MGSSELSWAAVREAIQRRDAVVLPPQRRQQHVHGAELGVDARRVASAPAGHGRRIRIVLSPGGGDGVSIRFPESAQVLALGLPGGAVSVPANGEPKKAALRCTGRSCEGLVIEALLSNPRPVTVELYSTRFGLPPQAAPLVAARPRNAIPQYAPDSTITRSHMKL